MRRLGVNLGVFPGMDRKEDIAYLKAAGFDSTFVYYFRREDATLIRKTAEWLSAVGIMLETVHAPFWASNAMWTPGEEGEEFFSQLCDSVEVAGECGVPVVIMHLSSGDHPPFPNEFGMARFDRLVELAEKHGVILAYENQRKIANLAHVLERYEGNPHVGFCWDVGHEHCLSGGWEYMPMFGDRVCALHIHDNRRVHNGDLHMIPGDGEIDFDVMAKYIRKYRYDGTVMLELMQKPSGLYDTVAPEVFFDRAYRAAEALRDRIDGGVSFSE